MLSFTLFGIPVRIELWFWITMAFLGGAIHAQTSYEMLLVVMFMLAGLISILVHEFGHALTIRKFGLSTSITLQAFGGFASYPAGILTRKQSFLVTAAGPALQLVLGIGVLILSRVIQVPEGSLLNGLIHYLIWISIVWAIFNCFPIYPLDGGQMMAAVLGPRRQKYVHLISAFCAVTIGLLAFAKLGTWLLPLFMVMFAWQNWQSFQQHRAAS